MDEEIKQIIADIFGVCVSNYESDEINDYSEWVINLAEKIRDAGYKKQ